MRLQASIKSRVKLLVVLEVRVGNNKPICSKCGLDRKLTKQKFVVIGMVVVGLNLMCLQALY